MIQERLRTTGLARNRFLAYAGTAIVAAAVQAWFPGRAEAAPPNGCSEYNGCPCCNHTGCCHSSCESINACGNHVHCWRTCAYEGSTLVSFSCCDYSYSGGSCICREDWGSC